MPRGRLPGDARTGMGAKITPPCPERTKESATRPS